MAKSKSGDGFSVDFSNLFPDDVIERKSTPKETPKEKEEPKRDIDKNVEDRLNKSEHKKGKANSYTETPVTEVEKDTKAPDSTKKTAKAMPVQKEKVSDLASDSSSNSLIYVTIYLESEEDRAYLKFRSKELSLSVSEFLQQMIEQDDLTNVDLSDSLHEKFRSIRLPLSTSVKATVEEKRIMQLHAAKHRLLTTRFIGYLIQKNRLSDSEWENI
jgi:hypothetical protein